MHRLALICVVFLLITRAHAESFGVMTYNCQHGDIGAGTIGKIINDTGAKIVGVEEAPPSFVTNLVNDLNSRRVAPFTYTWTAVRTQPPPGYNDLDAILTTYPVVSSQQITLHSSGDRYNAIRTCLQATLNVNSVKLNFFVTHLSLAGDVQGGERIRTKQCREIRDFMKSFSSPRFLVGDFNTDPEHGWADHTADFNILLEAGLVDSYRDVNTDPGKTHPVARPLALDKWYDHILYSKYAGIACTSSRVVNNADTYPPSGTLPSDHFPVVSQFNWNMAVQAYPPAGETLGSNAITCEVYSGITGDSIASLTGSANFPNNPSSTTSLTAALQTPFNFGDNYGQRVRGFVTAPVSGSYTFTVAGTNNVELWLSTDANPANKQKIAWIGGSDYTLNGQWSAADGADSYGSPRWVISASSQTTSAAKTLTAGQKYYIEVLHKAGTSGSDSLSVGWSLPDGRIERPIPAFRLSPPAATPPPNQAPNVNAGPDLNFNLPSGATLNGTASDDGLPNPPAALTLAWSKVSGPGTVTFGNSAAAVTTATFSTSGTYVLRLSANDGALTSSDDVTVTVNPTPAGLPAPWLHRDIGGVNVAGNASYSSGTFTVNASGTDIYDTADAFHYVYQPWSGDGEIVVKVSDISNAGAWSLAAVMFRETLAADSKHASMMVTNAGKAKFRFRTAAGATTVSNGPAGDGTNPLPRWLKLSRSGNSFTAYTSADGSSWTIIDQAQTIAMNSSAYVGFIALRNDNAALCNATISNVSVVRPNAAPVIGSASATPTTASVGETISFSASAADPDGDSLTYTWNFGDGSSGSGASAAHGYSVSGTYNAVVTVSDGHGGSDSSSVSVTVVAAYTWTEKDIGAVGIAGSFSQSGTYTINGAGKELYDVVDGFHYVYQTLNGDGTIVARVQTLNNPNEWCQAGVMMRETLADNSCHVTMMATVSGRAKFRRRYTTGGATTSNGPGAGGVALPQWVKLVRSGNTFSGYCSNDGVTWTLIGTDTVTMSSNVYVGLYTTSAVTTALGTAAIDNVSISGSVSASRSLAAKAMETQPPSDFLDLGVFSVSDKENIFVNLPVPQGFEKGARWKLEDRKALPPGVKIGRGKAGGKALAEGVYTFSVTISTKAGQMTQKYRMTVGK